MTRHTQRITTLIAACATAAITLIGCQSKPAQVAEWTDETRKETNSWMIRTYFDKQMENGIVRQHTLWSHHFIDGTHTLNERGQRDLHILAEHYIRHNGGMLNMPRNGTPREIYERRLDAVRESLASAGVSVDSVVFDADTWTGQTQSSIRSGADVIRPSDPKPFNFHEGDAK